MPTRKDLVRMTLLKLGVADSGEAPEKEDASDVDLHVQAKLLELYGDGLIPFDVDGDIPSRYLVPLSYVVALELLADYGVGGRAEMVVAGANRSMKALYRFASLPYSGAVAPVEYF